MSYFNPTDPREMLSSFFRDALDIDYKTAIRANTTAQEFSILPRHWYIDARLRCHACSTEFLWSAREQKAWFETFRFYVDSQPTLCRPCRAKRRHALELRREYDALVEMARAGGTSAQKKRIAEIIDQLESYWSRIPTKMSETRELFRRQVAKGTLPNNISEK